MHAMQDAARAGCRADAPTTPHITVSTSNIENLVGWAHDFRNAASVILGYADLYATSTCSKERFLDALRSNCRYLCDLADALCESEPLGTLERTAPMADVFHAVVDSYRLAGNQKAIDLTVASDPSLPVLNAVEVTVVRRVLANLLSNAIRHSGGKKITVRAGQGSCRQSDGGPKTFCFLEVEDNGVGMPAQYVERLMDCSPSTNPGKREKQDSWRGCGLDTVNRLTEQIGGRVTVNSRVGQGTHVRVEFGLAPNENVKPSRQSQQAASSTKANTTAIAGMKVLVIDDDEEVLQLVSAMLQTVGLKTEVASAPEDVRPGLVHGFDAVLIDLQLGRNDGRALAAELRHQGYERPILAMTAHGAKMRREKASDTKGRVFDGWIDKTNGRNDLVTQLGGCITSSHRRSWN